MTEPTTAARERLHERIPFNDAETHALIEEALREAAAQERERIRTTIRTWMASHAAQMSADTLQAYADFDAILAEGGGPPSSTPEPGDDPLALVEHVVNDVHD